MLGQGSPMANDIPAGNRRRHGRRGSEIGPARRGVDEDGTVGWAHLEGKVDGGAA
jgi:hypothetical protein